MSATRSAPWLQRWNRFGLSGATSVTGALGGVIRNKLFAAFLDTGGMGVLAQVLSSQTWLGTMTGGGLSLPLSQQVGAALGAGDAPRVRRALWSALLAVGGAALVVCAIGLAIAPWLSVAVLGSPQYATLVRWSMLGVAGLALQVTLQGLFAGYSDVRAPFTYALIGNVVACTLVVLLVPRFGITGAVIGVGAFFPSAIAGTLWIHRRHYRDAFVPAPEPRFDGGVFRRMLKVAAAALLLALLDQGVLLGTRAHYVRVYGLDANGLLQAALALTQQVGALFYAYLGGYAFGKISGLSGAAAVRDYTRRQWRWLVPAAAIIAMSVMLAAGPVLHILYSHRFDPARRLMVWMLLGEFGKIAMLTWSVGALPLGGIRLWFPNGLAYTATMLAAYVALQPLGAGDRSLPFAYATAGLVSAAVAAVRMSRHGVTIPARDLLIPFAALAVLAALAFTLGR